MKFDVQHRTLYSYDAPVRDSINEAWLCPVSDDLQICHKFDLRIEPSGASVLRRLDFYTNQVHSFELVEPHDRLEVVSSSTVETFSDKRDLKVDSDPGLLPALQRDEWLYDFLNASKHVAIPPMIIHEARDLVTPMQDVQQAVEQIMAFIDAAFTYSPGATLVETSVTEVFEERNGVCQDFAHVMIALCRAVGIPARYVSGYFWIEKSLEGEADDNTQSHAWVECYLPGIGWVGYDPTHNRRVSEIYIKVAIGRDYADVRPLYGTYRGKSRAVMDVAVKVLRLDQ